LQKITRSVKSFFGLAERKENTALTPSKGMPGLLGFVSGIFMPMVQLIGSMMKDAQGDVKAVMDKACNEISCHGPLGNDVTSGQIMRQSYSSMNINGRQMAQVEVEFQVTGSKGSGMAYCGATIGEDNTIDLHNIRVNGASIGFGKLDPNAPGVIDV